LRRRGGRRALHACRRDLPRRTAERDHRHTHTLDRTRGELEGGVLVGVDREDRELVAAITRDDVVGSRGDPQRLAGAAALPASALRIGAQPRGLRVRFQRSK